ncbi:MAG: nucleotidyltransferase domain-containing protein [Candidatus Aenigmatarchaeota archaeon]
MKGDVIEAIKEVAGQVLKDYDGRIKAIWIYGSAVRKGEFKKTSDIDMMFLIDDSDRDVKRSELAEIDNTITKIIKKVKKEKKISLHPQSPKRLSDWWDLLRSGEPWVFTSMRDAIPVYDPSGYLEPIQRLLRGGRLHGTWERAQMLIERAPARIDKAKRIFLNEITADLLVAMVESSQAVLMFAGVVPPAAPSIGIELKKNFVPKNLEQGYIEWYEDFFEVTRKIEHGQMTKVSGRELEKWIGRTKAYLMRMEKLFSMLEEKKKKELIEEAHKESIEACLMALKKVGKKPKEKEVLKYVNEYLIKPGLVDKAYLELLKKIFGLKTALEKGKLEELPEKDIYSSVMYAKNLRNIMKGVKVEKKPKRD